MASLADMPNTNAFRILESSWGLIRLKRGHLVTSAMVPLLPTLATAVTTSREQRNPPQCEGMVADDGMLMEAGKGSKISFNLADVFLDLAVEVDTQTHHTGKSNIVMVYRTAVYKYW